MNGCQYMRPKFTLPASEKTDQQRWDLAMLTDVEYRVRYGISEEEYKRLVAGQ
jgi:hypothetical protein